MDILHQPIVTEKMTIQGDELNRFGFIVDKNANKIQIKKAVEEMYGVTVAAVNTMKYGGKSKSRYTKSGIITGKTNAYKKAIVTLADAASVVPEEPPRDDYTYYFWHSKFNKQGTRVCQVLRCIFPDFEHESTQRNPLTISFDADGSNINFCLPDFRPIWGNSGGHPNWLPNGDYIVRVLKFPDGNRYFATFKYDGSDFKQLCKNVKAGGHPTIEEREKYLITDSNPQKENGKFTQLHLVDLIADEEEIICELPSINWAERHDDNVYRVDGHPVWSRDYKQVCIQAAPEGARQLFVVDLSNKI